MSNDALALAAILWLIAAAAALAPRAHVISRIALVLGCLAGCAGALMALPHGAPQAATPFTLLGANVSFAIAPSAAWLMLFGLLGATVATWLATPGQGRASWCFGAALSLLGALGVFGLQDGLSFLISWELMSLGGAILILSDALARDSGRPVLFMLALLEAGVVALVIAFLVLANAAGGFGFADMSRASANLSEGWRCGLAVLLLIGFGAKIGLAPFYEWFPDTYAAGSGASGALLSGVILNAAFFALARGLTTWGLSAPGLAFDLFDGAVIAIAVISAILTTLYAFQQEDWRSLLGLSSAENGSIAVVLLGVSLVFVRDGHPDLAGLAWAVAHLHLAGHALAKSGLFLTADGVYRAASDYTLRQTGLLRKSAWPFGVGALFCGMSLAAMPPQAGFASEWYLFQTVFQGFHLSSLGNRLLFVMAGAGLAVMVAIALAAFVKVLGIGLLGRGRTVTRGAPAPYVIAVALLGAGVLALGAGMPVWLSALAYAAPPGYAIDAVTHMRDHWTLVPLTSSFAFISPSALIIALPLLALFPIALLLLSRRGAVRRAPVWYGGREQDPTRVATTALAFSNALRTFYSFVYRPTAETRREHASNGNGKPYFVRRLTFSHDVGPVFGPLFFKPIESLFQGAAKRLRSLQSGRLDFYLALVGLLLVVILVVSLT
jgi:formate hydrogenlyase subunit 3/multisubunit Na+/H+ antiporter MnhD subunit